MSTEMSHLPSLGRAARSHALLPTCATLLGAAWLSAGCGGEADRVAAPPPVAKKVAQAERTTPTRERIAVPKRRSLVCKLPRGTEKLPPSRRRGLIDHLLQYPDVTLATRGERRRAEHTLAQLVSSAEAGNWRNPAAAAHAGYSTRTAPRKPGDYTIRYFHSERHQEPRGRVLLDPRRPKALIYANAPGRPLVLVGAMWSMRDGERGPNPGGPITRWHTHVVCGAPGRRGLKAPPNGKCPPGTRLMQGQSEMMHVWFTKDLRSAFAIRAPEPELCTAGLLPGTYCEKIT